MENWLLLIVVLLSGAIAYYGEMQRRTSTGLISRQNELVIVQDQQHQRQVEADKKVAQALAELSLHVQQGNQISRDQQSIMASMHVDWAELSGDVSRGQNVIDNKLGTIDNRLELVDDRLEAIMDLAGQIYKAVDTSNTDARSMLDTMLSELRAIGTYGDVVPKEEAA